MFPVREFNVNRKHFSVKTLVSTYLEYFFPSSMTSQANSVFPCDSERPVKVWGVGSSKSVPMFRKTVRRFRVGL